MVEAAPASRFSAGLQTGTCLLTSVSSSPPGVPVRGSENLPA
jgi:hypothetical protein